MKTTGNTILISGGSAGIGLEIAKLFSRKNNKIIITGRNSERLSLAKQEMPGLTAIQCDVTENEQIRSLLKRLYDEFPDLNIVVNSAALAFNYNLAETHDTFVNAQAEMLTNYLVPAKLNEGLLPLLKKQRSAAIVNITSVTAFKPNPMASTYSASKAALHSYSESLRYLLEPSKIKVFELIPPTVNTEFSKMRNGINGISPSLVANCLAIAMEKDEFEINISAEAAHH